MRFRGKGHLDYSKSSIQYNMATYIAMLDVCHPHYFGLTTSESLPAYFAGSERYAFLKTDAFGNTLSNIADSIGR